MIKSILELHFLTTPLILYAVCCQFHNVISVFCCWENRKIRVSRMPGEQFLLFEAFGPLDFCS